MMQNSVLFGTDSSFKQTYPRSNFDKLQIKKQIIKKDFEVLILFI